MPKVKTTYTRKKISYPTPPTAQDQDTPIDDEAEDTMVEESESMVEEGESMARSIKDPDASMVGDNSVDAQILQEAVSTGKVLSDEEPTTNSPEDEDEVYVVEYFMADGYRKVCLFSLPKLLLVLHLMCCNWPTSNSVQLHGSNIPEKILLTKWAGFDLVRDLTWEPESEMKYVSWSQNGKISLTCRYYRNDVPNAVKAYYAKKISSPSSTDREEASEKPVEVSKKPRGRPPKITKAARGRPRKDSTVPLGQPPKITKASRGRPRKDSKVPLGRPPKNGKPRLGRPPKNTQARRGRSPKVRSPGSGA
jgi:hypothetical protein